MPSERMYGSIDVTKIIELMKRGHSSLSKSEKNGHIYMNIVQWVHSEEDKYGNRVSIQPSCDKNATDAEKTDTKGIYLGNLKIAKPEPPAANDVADAEAALTKMGGTITAVPAGQQPAQTAAVPAGNGAAALKPVDDLPF